VPQLAAPSPSVRSSFVQALAEYRGEGRYTNLDPAELREAPAFGRYIEGLSARSDVAWESPEDRVRQTVLWWVEGDAYLGRVSIRHLLTKQLERRGGHIGYDVRPSARRRGHGTRMLAAALPIARSLGIDPALVTCDAANVASRRIIVSAGGRLQDELDGELRFWVPTSR
jgi:predicted acetyltransferase